MKPIIGLFTEQEKIEEYFQKKPDFFQGYFEFAQEVARQGGDVYLVGPQSRYLGNGKFSSSQHFTDSWIEEHGEVSVDVIFDKGDFIPDHTIPVFNNEFVNNLCTDKLLMYKTFTDLCPITIVATNTQEVENAIQKINTELVVIKPQYGGEGKGVAILPKNKVSTSSLEYPVIVQEFMDTSSGVPEIVNGLHDFRIAILNGEIIYSYYRTPPTGSFLANVSKGGRFEVVPIEKIPAEAIKIVKIVETKMIKSPKRFYGIDLAFTPQGIKLIEMNSKLGLLPNKDGNEFKILKEKLASTMLSLVSHSDRLIR